MRRAPPWPALPERFPPPFRALLRELLARGAAVRGGSDDRHRAARTVRSHSGTFVGHRPYVRGDDVRRIDWAAAARSGELFVKLFEEERRRTVTLVVDLSPRLLVGTPPRRLAALRLAAIVGGLALRHLDGLTIAAPGAGGAALARFAGARDLDALLRHLDELPVAAAPPEAAIPLVTARGVSGRLHWISDFADPERFELPLAALRRRGAAITGWLPWLREDHEPPRPGYLRVHDPDTGAELAAALDDALAAELRRQLALLERRQQRLFVQSGSTLVRWRAPAADDFGTASFQEIVAWCAR